MYTRRPGSLRARAGSAGVLACYVGQESIRIHTAFPFLTRYRRRGTSRRGRLRSQLLVREVLVDNATLHYKDNTSHRCDVLQRITVERDDVRLQTYRD